MEEYSNNNLADDPVGAYGIPTNLDNTRPKSTVRNAKYIGSIYLILKNYLREDISSLKKIQDFLNQYILALFVTNGNTRNEWKGDDITPHITDESCSYLGTRISYETGCKTTYSEKLMRYIKIMEQFLVAFVGNLSTAMKQQMIADETTMTLFMKAIRNLLYFYGQKQIGPILSGKDNHFLLFFNNLNTLFGKEILQVACNQVNTYGCGRFVGLAKCDRSHSYYVYIYRTEGEYSTNVPNDYASVILNRSKACGGSRKSRSRRVRRLRKQKSRKI
jgi:hypothetical protein